VTTNAESAKIEEGAPKNVYDRLIIRAVLEERPNMKYSKIPGLLFILLTSVVSPVFAASASDWRYDIDEMVKDVQAIHPDPYARCGRLSFLRAVDALKRSLPHLNEEQRMAGAMKIVALIGDTHTQLEPDRPDFALWYPIRIYEFSDGYYVTAAHSSVAELAGARLLEVAGKPIENAVADVRALRGADNAFASKEDLSVFSDAALMKGLGYAASDGSMRVKLKLTSGKSVQVSLNPHVADDPRFGKNDSTFEWRFQAEMGGPPIGGVDQWISAYKAMRYASFRTTDKSRPLRLMNRRFFAAKARQDSDAYYIQSNFVGDDFADQFRMALAEVDRLKPKRLIVDLRYNFGGDGSRAPAMAREFIKRGDAPPWKELYVITGRRTHSAGIMAAIAIMDNTEHSVIGEPMAAPVNSYGDATSIMFEKTGMKLWLSTVRHQLGDDRNISEFTPVDVPAPMLFGDYAAGRDPAVDPILRGEEMRGIAVIALNDGGAAARRTYQKRAKTFSKTLWWTPPQEIELRIATDKLVGQKRFDDAIETAKLNAEIHPDVWNTWYNLGVAQRAGNRMRESLESWRKVLELDPQNGNGDEIRSAFEAAGVDID
jgi:tetratricopeptide (TPR) repeat protein